MRGRRDVGGVHHDIRLSAWIYAVISAAYIISCVTDTEGLGSVDSVIADADKVSFFLREGMLGFAKALSTQTAQAVVSELRVEVLWSNMNSEFLHSLTRAEMINLLGGVNCAFAIHLQ